MDVNVLCWCDQTADAAHKQEGQQARLLQAIGLVRQLAGKLTYLEQQAVKTSAAALVDIDVWNEVLGPLHVDDEVAAFLLIYRDFATSVFNAALLWHCNHPQATLEESRIAAKTYAEQLVIDAVAPPS